MGLKILHSADWHLDSPFASFPPEQRELLRRKQRLIPGIIADSVRRECCDLVLLAGDLFDAAPSRETLEDVKDALARCAVPVFISPGNHDYCGPGSPWLEERWPENVHVFTGGLEAVAVPELSCRVYGAGYRSMDCLPLLEGFRAEGTEKYCVAVLHGDPTTVKSPYCAVTAAQVRDSGLDYLALGHIHKAGAFRTGATLCAWPGCPMGRGWDETGDKGVCIVTLDEGVEIHPLALDLLTFQEFTVDISGGAEEALEAQLPGVANEDFYRITLTGRGEMDLDALRQRFTVFPNLELRDKTLPALDLWKDAGEDTLRGVYFALLRQAAEEEGSVLARQAAEISQALLEGREVALP